MSTNSLIPKLAVLHRQMVESVKRQFESAAAQYAKQVTADLPEIQDKIREEIEQHIAHYAKQAIAAFLVKLLSLRVLEERGIGYPYRIKGTALEEGWARLVKNLGLADYVDYAFRNMAYVVYDLFRERDYDRLRPEDRLIERALELLARWMPPLDFDTRVIGDLYEQLLGQEEQKRFGYYQTPDFIIEFILEHTLKRKFQEKDFEEVTFLDPACGSGHFLLWAYRAFAEQYRRRYPTMKPGEIYRRIIGKHIWGIDISEFACAIARFRLALEGLPYFKEGMNEVDFHICCADTLRKWEEEERQMRLPLEETIDPIASLYGKAHYQPTRYKYFAQKYDIVASNPPYVRIQNLPGDISNAYRKTYISAHGNFDLSVLFLERGLELLADKGYLGYITTGKFTKQQYGKKLVGEVLPTVRMLMVLDLTDGKVFPQGVYPCIIVLQKRPEINPQVKVATTYKEHPDRRWVWERVKGNLGKREYFDGYIGVYFEDQKTFSRIPWVFKRGERDLLDKIRDMSAGKTLSDYVERIGFDFISAADAVFCSYTTQSFIRRLSLENELLVAMLRGRNIRNWQVTWEGNKEGKETCVVCPHTPDGGRREGIGGYKATFAFLRRYRDCLERRRIHSTNVLDLGINWYELAQSTFELGHPKLLVPTTATHAHFYLDGAGAWIAKHSCQVIYLKDSSADNYRLFLGLLNSSVTNYAVKNASTKLAGKTEEKARYDFSKKFISQIPIKLPTGRERERLIRLVDKMTDLAEEASSLTAYKVLRWEYRDATHLWELWEGAVRRRRQILNEMKVLQDEMDHLVYKIYGITDPEDIAILEQPLYKRPWPTSEEFEKKVEKEFAWEALDWLRDKLEDLFRQARQARPYPLRALAARLMEDAKVRAVAAVYVGREDFNLERILRKAIQEDCIPNRKAHWPPKKWKEVERDKVEIEHERFIEYLDYGRDWYGWTGWDAQQRANALFYLLDRARKEGHDDKGLREALRELAQSPDLSPEAKRAVELVVGS